MGTNVMPINFGIFPWLVNYTPVIPKLYWNVYSQEERMKWLSMEWDRIYHYLLSICEKINIDDNRITELEKQFEEFKTHGFDDYYREQIEQWIKDNFTEIIENAIQILFFGLTEDGYFCAYIPKNWAKYIQFTTGADYTKNDYGCLEINY